MKIAAAVAQRERRSLVLPEFGVKGQTIAKRMNERTRQSVIE